MSFIFGFLLGAIIGIAIICIFIVGKRGDK